MTTSGTARRHCSPPSTCSTAGSSAMARHRHQEFIRFLNKINRETPGGRELHLIVDNYATHKHPRVRACLERHKRGVFKGIVDLQTAISRFLAETNQNPQTLHLDRRPRRHNRKGSARETGV